MPEPALLRVSRRDGSARLLARELRRRRPVPRDGSLHARRPRHGRASCRMARASKARTICATRCSPSRSSSCRRSPERSLDLRPRPPGRVLGHAHGAQDHARAGHRHHEASAPISAAGGGSMGVFQKMGLGPAQGSSRLKTAPTQLRTIPCDHHPRVLHLLRRCGGRRCPRPRGRWTG